ncbi:MAG: hypothetical protein DCC49_02890 [Acidobacteria bacterium]|nr:MAG: hypothetical protein DCC49_02890 [Acidobacteriota bacterium]
MDSLSQVDDLAERIRSRGHWHVVIRPTKFDKERVRYADLERVIGETRVSVRGWDLPHVDDPSPIERGENWVGRHVEFDYHLEVWRLYQSGQFVHLNCLREDWRDESSLYPADADWQLGGRLGVGDALYTLGEYFEFAARLALSDAGDSLMAVRIRLHNLQDRQLWVEDPMRSGFLKPQVTKMDEFALSRDLPREELVAKPRELATEAARELFARFGWDAPLDTLRDHLESLWNWRR